MRRLAKTPELLDGPLDDRPALVSNLDDLARVNRWMGGAALSRRALLRLARQPRPGGLSLAAEWRTRPLRLLDVGTGAADIPAHLLDWAERHGRWLEIAASDSRPEVIEVARARVAGRPGIVLSVADARALPFPDGSLDVAHASLLLHHLEPDEARQVLAELRRVARHGVVVNDLERSRLGYLGARLLGRLCAHGRWAELDAPLSVRRAYRAPEVARLAAEVGLVEVGRVVGYLGHRYAIAFQPAARAPAAASAPATAGVPLTAGVPPMAAMRDDVTGGHGDPSGSQDGEGA